MNTQRDTTSTVTRRLASDCTGVSSIGSSPPLPFASMREPSIPRCISASFAASARFCEPRIAEELAGSLSGAILPFAFDPRLELLVDPAIAGSETMYFNAGRLDRSVALATKDYLRIARPEIAEIAVR